MRCSVIEIGSNTVKCTVYDIAGKGKDKRAEHILSQTQTLGLINYTSDGILSPAGIKRLCETVLSLVKLSKNVYCKKIYPIATAGLRNLDNIDDVLKKVKGATGYTIGVISGEDEAMYGFEALTDIFRGRLEDGIAVDLGGGSTEIVLIKDGKAVRAESIRLGALKLYGEYVSGVLPTPSEQEEIAKAFDRELERIDWLPSAGKVAYLIGGSGRALFTMNSDVDGTPVRNGSRLPANKIDALGELYREPGEDDIRRLIRLLPDRVHLTVPGMIAYRRIFKKAGTETAIVSFSKVRDGFIKEKYFKGKTAGEDEKGN